ncbi:MAG TPA: hypothetical protein VK988_22825, partial [Acidimicrobiales bacterium]|nr:hypothetical protein [Acidimicrobiales bacterium]
MRSDGACVGGEAPLDPPSALREEKLRRFLCLLIAYQALAQIGAALGLLAASTPVDRTTERILLAFATAVLLLSGIEALVIRSRRVTPLRNRYIFIGTVVLLTLALNLASAIILPNETLFIPALDLFGICLITMAALVTAIYGTRAGLMTFACAGALQILMAVINGYTLTTIGWSQLVARQIWVGLGVLAAYGVMSITDELEIVTRDAGERSGQLRAIDIMHDRALQDVKA